MSAATTALPAHLTKEEADQLVLQHERLVWRVATRVARGYPEEVIEDLASEVRLWLLTATSTFDPSKGVKFVTYVWWLLWPRAKDWLSVYRRRGLPRGTIVQTDIEGTEALDELAVAPEPIVKPEFPSNFWRKIKEALTPEQWEAVRLHYIRGRTQLDIAHIRGTGRKATNAILRNAYERLRKSLPELAVYLR